MMLKFLQINSSRRKSALELALNTAKQLDSDFLLVSGPNTTKCKSLIELDKRWTSDLNSDAAVRSRGVILAEKSGSENGFTWQTSKKITIFSCYTSPNSDIPTFSVD